LRGTKEQCIRWGIYGRHLANIIEQSVLGCCCYHCTSLLVINVIILLLGLVRNYRSCCPPVTTYVMCCRVRQTPTVFWTETFFHTADTRYLLPAFTSGMEVVSSQLRAVCGGRDMWNCRVLSLDLVVDLSRAFTCRSTQNRSFHRRSYYSVFWLVPENGRWVNGRRILDDGVDRECLNTCRKMINDKCLQHFLYMTCISHTPCGSWDQYE